MKSVEVNGFDKGMVAFQLGRTVECAKTFIQANWSLYSRLSKDIASAKQALQEPMDIGVSVSAGHMPYVHIPIYEHELQVLSENLYSNYTVFDVVELLCNCIASTLDLKAAGMLLKIESISRHKYTLVLLNKRYPVG